MFHTSTVPTVGYHNKIGFYIALEGLRIGRVTADKLGRDLQKNLIWCLAPASQICGYEIYQDYQ